jgi:hypothetical protein
MIDRPTVIRGLSSLRLFGTTMTLLLATAVAAQQGPGGGPPPPMPATPVQENELVETWNERVSAGPPVGAFGEFDGWSMGHAMPLARSEHGVAELDGKIWVLGGYPPGRLPQQRDAGAAKKYADLARGRSPGCAATRRHRAPGSDGGRAGQRADEQAVRLQCQVLISRHERAAPHEGAARALSMATTVPGSACIVVPRRAGSQRVARKSSRGVESFGCSSRGSRELVRAARRGHYL